MNKKIVLVIVLSFLLSSCSTMKRNTFIGASLGATAGSIGGTVIGAPNNPVPGALVGTATGAAIGALIGFLTEPKTSKQVDVSVAGSKSSDLDSPSVMSPEVRRLWVPDKIEGNKYIKGHYMYVIERGTVWTMQ